MPSVVSESWRWKLRLFVSTDLVGSTAFKAAPAGHAEWSPTFKEFFRDFPIALDGQYSRLKRPYLSPTEKLRPWKFSGDEILFWVELRRFEEAASHLLAVKRAMKEFPCNWKEKAPLLSLKGTAWLAGFPVTNTEINIPMNGSGGDVLDFIGPSIDLGFRVARYCDQRKLVVSADLALMLLDSVEKLEISRKHFRLHLHACEVLKGVISNTPYPVFWIDMLDGKPVLEERLLGVRREFSSDDVKDYLRVFIDKTKLLRRPFIEGDVDQRYGTIDPSLEDIRADMIAEESSRNYSKGGEEEHPPTGVEKEIKPPTVEKLRPSDDDIIPGVPS